MSDVHPRAVQSVLLDLPGLLFFTTYTLLVLFWAEIYHQVDVLTTVLSSNVAISDCPAGVRQAFAWSLYGTLLLAGASGAGLW